MKIKIRITNGNVLENLILYLMKIFCLGCSLSCLNAYFLFSVNNKLVFIHIHITDLCGNKKNLWITAQTEIYSFLI